MGMRMGICNQKENGIGSNCVPSNWNKKDNIIEMEWKAMWRTVTRNEELELE